VNKKRVNSLLLVAKQALAECGIAENGKISSAFRGQISSFGAAIVTGNLPAATAFFSVQGGSDVKRDRLLNAVYYCICENDRQQAKNKHPKEILQFVCENNNYDLKEKIIDASIALKLAMNFYELVSSKGEAHEKSEFDIQ